MSTKRRKWTAELFLEEAKKIHGDCFEYDLSTFINTKSRIKAKCLVHDVEFHPVVSDHIFKASKCPKCKSDSVREAIRATGICASMEAFLSAARAAHGDSYDYSRVQLGGVMDPVEVVCPKEGHGAFFPTPTNHVHAGTKCPVCSREEQSSRRRQLPEGFIADCTAVHGGKYDYSATSYSHSHGFIEVTCPEHGSFRQVAYDHKQGHGCPKCGAAESRPEAEIEELLLSRGITCTRNHPLECGLQIDVYCPSERLGIEYNGLRWHSDEFRAPGYHLHKTLRAQKEGIHLIHVYEDEWLYKRELCQNWILDKLGIHAERRYARNCRVVELRWREAATFLMAHHIQGASAPGSVNLGLMCEESGELVGVMCFSSREEQEPGSIGLTRFCTRGKVVGGFSKMLRHFLRNRPEGLKRVTSFADRRWSSGNVYAQNGFRLDSVSPPDYYWVKGQRRYVKERFRHCRIAKLFSNYDPGKSEAENCVNNGYRKLYDCGKLKWVLDLS